MNILFQNRWNLDTFSGCQKQIALLMKNLNKRGHQTQFSNDPNIDLWEYDVVFVTQVHFDFTRDVCINCIKQRKPYVVKTLCYPEVYDNFKDDTSNSVYASNQNNIPFVVEHAAKLVCESQDERDYLVGICPEYEGKFRIVQPGVLEIYVNRGKPLSERRFVHSNGNYFGVKRMDFLQKICIKEKLPMVTCGFPDLKKKNRLCIFDKMRRRWADNIDWDNGTEMYVLAEKNSYELVEIYNNTRVYVCASWRELSSTSVCEAIACGCRVVSSSRHLANSNWPKAGYYVFDHSRRDSMRDAILEAYHADTTQENEIWYSQKLTDAYEQFFREAVSYRRL